MDKHIAASERINEILPKRNLLDVNLSELFQYKDLIYLFVKRDFISIYKQTILGPLWFFIQPIFTTLIFSFVFGRVGNFAPEDKPVFLYYLAGIVLWQYLADCLKMVSNTFIENQSVFGKVYFPRLVVPISIVISNLLKLGVQLILFIIVYIFFYLSGSSLEINATIALFPLLVIIMAGLGMGLGLIISSLTTKYRDMRFLIEFGIQLVMYVTPGIIMSYSDFVRLMPKYEWVFKFNPVGHIIETFKYATLDSGYFSWNHLLYSIGFTTILLIIGVILFNRTEKNFMDTV